MERKQDDTRYAYRTSDHTHKGCKQTGFHDFLLFV